MGIVKISLSIQMNPMNALTLGWLFSRSVPAWHAFHKTHFMNRSIRYHRCCGLILSLLFPVVLNARPVISTDSSGKPWVDFRLNASTPQPNQFLSPDLPMNLLPASADPVEAAIRDKTENEELLLLEKEIRNNRQNQRALIRILKAGKLRKAFTRKRYQERLLTDLSDIAAGMNLYPLALSYRQMQAELKEDISAQPLADTSMGIREEDTASDYSMVISGLKIQLNPEAVFPWDSEPVSGEHLIAAFEDQKEAVRYAMMLQVKQPKAGTRKAFTGIDNVGHMFVTLIKYNSDSSYVCRSFGFYPAKSRLLHATPLHPADDPVIKDDQGHEWDVAIGRFISARRFHRILRVLNRYETSQYHLNKNNCTDFGLTVAAVCGIRISDSRGTWPLGSGNNPANAGQSMLEGKIIDTESDVAAPVFLFNKLHLPTSNQK